MTRYPPDSILLSPMQKDTLWVVFRVDTAGYIHSDTLYPVARENFVSYKNYFQKLTKEMPPMEPALEKGLPVEVSFRIPIVFKNNF